MYFFFVACLCACALAAPSFAASASVAGKWKGQGKTNSGRERAFVLELTDENGKIAGTLSVDEGTVAIEDAKVEGNELTFKLSVDEGTYTIKVTVDGSSMKGSYRGPGGESGDITAAKS
jgi:hypothetical protein